MLCLFAHQLLPQEDFSSSTYDAFLVKELAAFVSKLNGRDRDFPAKVTSASLCAHRACDYLMTVANTDKSDSSLIQDLLGVFDQLQDPFVVIMRVEF